MLFSRNRGNDLTWCIKELVIPAGSRKEARDCFLEIGGVFRLNFNALSRDEQFRLSAIGEELERDDYGQAY